MIAMKTAQDRTIKKRTTGCGRPSAPSAGPQWHASYLRFLPDILKQAHRALRHLRGEAFEDALQEVLADTVLAYARLAELGREELAYPTPLVTYAVRKLYTGRRVGSRSNSHDVSSAYCHRRNGIVLERLDRYNGTSDEWQEILVEDQHATPAEVAAIRIDFCSWLESLHPRERRIAERLASGESTGRVANMFAVTAGRVSQLRRKLWTSWLVFTCEAKSRG